MARIKITPRYPFEIPIGDDSHDGHGHCDRVLASAAKPVEAVREAYFAAKARLDSDTCPENLCDGDGEELTPAQATALLAAGAPLPNKLDEFHWDSRHLAAVVVWYLNQGDPTLDARLEAAPPSLCPPGHDAQGRRIGQIGYGMNGWCR